MARETREKHMLRETEDITRLILDAKRKAVEETGTEPEPGLTQAVQWPTSVWVSSMW